MLNYSYKLYQNKKNKQLHSLIDSAASIWNHCVRLNNRFYKIYRCSISRGKLEKHIAKLRKSNPYWLKLNSQTVQEIVQRYEKSLVAFFKKQRKRRPKLKRWHSFSSIVFKQAGYKLASNRLSISGVGHFKFHLSRSYGKIQNIRIRRTSCGDLFIIICSKEVISSKVYPRKSDQAAPVGIDFGLKTFLTLSTGQSITSPGFYRHLSKEIKRKQKRLSCCQKSSSNRKSRRLALARTYRKLNNLRADHQWKLAHELCSAYSHIFLEDLNLVGMQRLWGRKISDLCFAEFVTKLKHIAGKYRTLVHQIDRYYPSSKQCCACGELKTDLCLRDRSWICASCGAKHDRDLNAAKNILRQGIVSFQRKSKTSCLQQASFACMEESTAL